MQNALYIFILNSTVETVVSSVKYTHACAKNSVTETYKNSKKKTKTYETKLLVTNKLTKAAIPASL